MGRERGTGIGGQRGTGDGFRGGYEKGFGTRLCGVLCARESRNLDRTAAAERGSFRGVGVGWPLAPRGPTKSSSAMGPSAAVELSNSKPRALGIASCPWPPPVWAQRYMSATCKWEGRGTGEDESSVRMMSPLERDGTERQGGWVLERWGW